MAETKQKAAATAVTTAEPVEVDPHAEAFAERQRDTRYDDPTVATPGVLEDIDEDAGHPTALVAADTPSALDPSVDNRDQVQPMLDRLAESVKEEAEQTPEQVVEQREAVRESLTTESSTTKK